MASSSGGLSPAGKGGGGGKGKAKGKKAGFSLAEGAWRAVPRNPDCLVTHFVPFSANSIGSAGLAAPSHAAFLQFEAEALTDNVVVRRSH